VQNEARLWFCPVRPLRLSEVNSRCSGAANAGETAWRDQAFEQARQSVTGQKDGLFFDVVTYLSVCAGCLKLCF
jgi:hypothetical protein